MANPKILYQKKKGRIRATVGIWRDGLEFGISYTPIFNDKIITLGFFRPYIQLWIFEKDQPKEDK